MEIQVGFALLLTTVAGLSTAIGGVIAYFIRQPRSSFLALILGFSAGVMVFVSFTELFRTALDKLGFVPANIAFFLGILFIALIDLLIPHEYKHEPIDEADHALPPGATLKLKRAGVFLALGIAIHNFPEGLVTFVSAATGNVGLGIAIAVAVAMHNIPEGISVSVPIYYATGKRGQAFLYSFLAGVAEPVGALIGYVLLFPFLTPSLMFGLLAFVAGVMVYISLDELLPLAHQYGQEHFVIIGIGAGMLVMAASLYLFA